jgi:2-oxoacid:acceptor oxidoreductase delta subunit (pyruvate/2-ketoisovalerate family)
MAKTETKKKTTQEPDWQELPMGGLMVDPGSAEAYNTGDWRTERPIHSTEKCINCLLCWMFCPDSSIMVVDGKVVGIDYDHCKGCGICAAECPPKVHAIDMEPESDFR